MARKNIFPFLIIIALSLLVVIPSMAASESSNPAVIQASNYCQACHSTGDSRLEQPTAWVGGIAHNQISPCPASNQIQEEIYYTERMMLAIDRARAQVPANIDLSMSDSRLAAAGQTYSRLLDAPVTSLEAFSAEARMVRFRLGKVYSAINQNIEAAKRARVLWGAIGTSAVIIASLIWGWINARKAIGSSATNSPKKASFYISRAAFLLLVFFLFALPVFRLPAQAIATTSAEEQERQTTIDESGRAALAADRELSRAWMLAEVGATWAATDPDSAEDALEEALAAAEEAHLNSAAFWGLSQAAREAGRAETDMQAKADLVSRDLDATRGRAWGLRLIAEAWINIDSEMATAILESAIEQSSMTVFPYDQLDLRAIAVTWAQFDQSRGVDIAQSISDPATRSWALREIAAISGDKALFKDAAQAARLVDDPVQQARALREVAVASGDRSLFSEAAAALEAVEGAERAYALADLAAAAEDSDLAVLISSDYQIAVALAYYSLGEFETAWQTAGEIADPFEQARAQAAIAGAWGNAEFAAQIENTLLRDRALRDISLKTGNPSLVDEMHDPYYQVQSLSTAGNFEEAWQIAQELKDGYPLVDLGVAWAESDPQAALQVIETLTREADKATVLQAIAATTGTPEDFESALGMALAARVSGNPLAPVYASIDLADAFSATPEFFDRAMQQAFETAQIINISY
jgi:hypothetical protein